MKWIPHEEQDEKSWIIIIIIYKQYQLNSKEETLKIKNKFMDDHMISILFCDCTDGSVGWLTRSWVWTPATPTLRVVK